MASFAPIRGTRAQIQATPIVDGQFLVETDQGVDNMIYMDEGSTRTIVGGNTVTGVLPELYIYSETGSVVTVEDAGGTLIPTSQVGTDHWVCEVPDYGIYTVYSLLSGETVTQSINVTDCMIYTIDDSHFHCNVVVTYPSGVGATCQISGGGETYSAPALNPPNTSYKFVVHGKNTTYTITTNVDGVTKTATVTTGTTLDQTYNVSMPYARVNLTVETPPITGNITCTDGTTTITRPVAANITLYLDLGTWTISGSDGIDTYDTEVIVSDLTVTYEADLSSALDGATVLPTDDIQTWLLCAKIKDKTTYTTLTDVLNDNETLQKLISSNNAMNYLVRSKTWINQPFVPILTEDDGNVINTGGEVLASMAAWRAFRGENEADSSTSGWVSGAMPCSIGYHFNTPVIINNVYWENRNYDGSSDTNGRNRTYKIQASHNGTDWDDLTALITEDNSNFPGFHHNVIFDNSTAYEYYRVYITASFGTYGGASKLQFYYGIVNDETAMRLIGEKGYALDVLLNDSDWISAMTNSVYRDEVISNQIPIMTSDTTPSGTCSASSVWTSGGNTFSAWKAFNGTLTSVEGDAWVATQNATNQWLQYEFDSPKIINGLWLAIRGNSNNVNVNHFKLLASNDGFSSQTIELTGELTMPVHGSGEGAFFTVNNNVAYKYYRFLFIDLYTGSRFIGVGEAKLYGKKDVDDTVYNIYSAADDTITVTPQGGGTAVTIPTNNDGYGTIAKTSLPNGTYTFVSSKAENPNNLGASDYYSQTITVFDGMIEVAFMPDNVLYWWGYKTNNIEGLTTANGWNSNGTGAGTVEPTYNINNIYVANTGSVLGGFGTKNPVNCTTMHVISKELDTSDPNAGIFILSSKNIQNQAVTPINTTANVKTYYQLSATLGNYYLCQQASNGKSFENYAFWYE